MFLKVQIRAGERVKPVAIKLNPQQLDLYIDKDHTIQQQFQPTLQQHSHQSFATTLTTTTSTTAFSAPPTPTAHDHNTSHTNEENPTLHFSSPNPPIPTSHKKQQLGSHPSSPHLNSSGNDMSCSFNTEMAYTLPDKDDIVGPTGNRITHSLVLKFDFKTKVSVKPSSGSHRKQKQPLRAIIPLNIVASSSAS